MASLSAPAIVADTRSVSPELETGWDINWEQSTEDLRQVMLVYASRQNGDDRKFWVDLLKQRFGEDYDREYRPQPLTKVHQKTPELPRTQETNTEGQVSMETSKVPLENFVEQVAGQKQDVLMVDSLIENPEMSSQADDFLLLKQIQVHSELIQNRRSEVTLGCKFSAGKRARKNLGVKMILVKRGYHRARKKKSAKYTQRFDLVPAFKCYRMIRGLVFGDCSERAPFSPVSGLTAQFKKRRSRVDTNVIHRYGDMLEVLPRSMVQGMDSQGKTKMLSSPEEVSKTRPCNDNVLPLAGGRSMTRRLLSSAEDLRAWEPGGLACVTQWHGLGIYSCGSSSGHAALLERVHGVDRALKIVDAGYLLCSGSDIKALFVDHCFELQESRSIHGSVDDTIVVAFDPGGTLQERIIDEVLRLLGWFGAHNKSLEAGVKEKSLHWFEPHCFEKESLEEITTIDSKKGNKSLYLEDEDIDKPEQKEVSELTSVRDNQVWGPGGISLESDDVWRLIVCLGVYKRSSEVELKQMSLITHHCLEINELSRFKKPYWTCCFLLVRLLVEFVGCNANASGQELTVIVQRRYRSHVLFPCSKLLLLHLENKVCLLGAGNTMWRIGVNDKELRLMKSDGHMLLKGLKTLTLAWPKRLEIGPKVFVKIRWRHIFCFGAGLKLWMSVMELILYENHRLLDAQQRSHGAKDRRYKKYSKMVSRAVTVMIQEVSKMLAVIKLESKQNVMKISQESRWFILRIEDNSRKSGSYESSNYHLASQLAEILTYEVFHYSRPPDQLVTSLNVFKSALGVNAKLESSDHKSVSVRSEPEDYLWLKLIFIESCILKDRKCSVKEARIGMNQIIENWHRGYLLELVKREKAIIDVIMVMCNKPWFVYARRFWESNCLGFILRSADALEGADVGKFIRETEAWAQRKSVSGFKYTREPRASLVNWVSDVNLEDKVAFHGRGIDRLWSLLAFIKKEEDDS